LFISHSAVENKILLLAGGLRMKGGTNRQALRAMSISVLLFATLAHNEAVTPLTPAAKEAHTPSAPDTLKTIVDTGGKTGLSRNDMNPPRDPVGTGSQSDIPPSAGVPADTMEHMDQHAAAVEAIKQDMRDIKKEIAQIKDDMKRWHGERLRDADSPAAIKATTADSITSKSSFYNYGRIAFGFEEMGLAFQFRCAPHSVPEKKQIVFTSGFGYDVRIPTDEYHNTLCEGHVKVGVFRDLAVYERLRIGAFLEAMEKMRQFETDPLLGEPKFNVYSIWATKARLGAILSVFCLKNFIFTYRIGFEGAYSTPPFYVNQDKTKLVKLGNGNFKVGLCGSETSIFEALLNNIGIYYSF
jgi:hypothetical protein